MPEISCADFTFPLLTRRQAFSLLRLLDFGYVDLGLFERNAHLQTSAMLALPKQSAALLKQDLERAGLQAADIFLQIGETPAQASVNDPGLLVRRENRSIFERALEFCSAVGCPHMTGLPGVPHAHDQYDLPRAAEETRWRVDVCRAAGIHYAIEPHIGSICADLVSTQQLLAAVPGLTLTLDYGHFVAAGHNSEKVHSLLPHASHLHMRGAAVGRLQTSVAENTIDFHRMLEYLYELRFSGVMALEYVWLDWENCNRCDTLSETVLLRQRLQAIAGSLQQKEGSDV